MTTEVPGYVTKTDLLITGELPPEQLRQRDLAALAEGDAGAASARTYQHIMGADPVKELSG